MAGFNQRGFSRRVLAEDLLDRMDGAQVCKGQSVLWSDCETKHLQAATKVQAAAAAEPAMEMCRECPVVGLCRQWAEVDRYTGLAAGQAWTAGKPRSPMVTRYGEGGLDPQVRRLALERVAGWLTLMGLDWGQSTDGRQDSGW